MRKLLRRRFVIAVPLLFIVSILTFVAEALTPGSAASALLGATATKASIAQLNQTLGLNKPFPVAYWDWVRDALQGNLGHSIFTGQAVTGLLTQRVPVTISLVVPSLVISLILGVAVGTFAAVRGGKLGRALDLLAMLGMAVPNFWLALLLIEFFAVSLHALPATGYVFPSHSLVDWVRSLIMPVVALSIGPITIIAQQSRDAISEVMARPFIRSLTSYGLPRRSVLLRHALPNAANPILTVTGLMFVALLTGSVFVEQIFNIPGLGSAVVFATTNHDVPVIQGAALYFVAMVIVVNLATDFAYIALNPRERT